MRNKQYLDNEQPEDHLIGEDQYDEDGRRFKMIRGKRFYQGREPKSQADKDLELIINRWRASGLSTADWMKQRYGL